MYLYGPDSGFDEFLYFAGLVEVGRDHDKLGDLFFEGDVPVRSVRANRDCPRLKISYGKRDVLRRRRGGKKESQK